jgi:hypothetical protein
MKQIILQIISLSLLISAMLQPLYASTGKKGDAAPRKRGEINFPTGNTKAEMIANSQISVKTRRRLLILTLPPSGKVYPPHPPLGCLTPPILLSASNYPQR